MGQVEELRAEIRKDNEWIREAVAREERFKDRIARLEEALRSVVNDVNDYERVNNLSPNPGRTECWDSVAHAKAVLRETLNR